jgi:hypothetical protein
MIQRDAWSFVLGVLFAVGLGISGMTQPAKAMIAGIAVCDRGFSRGPGEARHSPMLGSRT